MNLTAGQAAPALARVIRLAEFESVQVEPEDLLRDGRLEVYPNLHRKGYIEVRLRPGSIELASKGWIGIIPVNDRLTLEVVPRVPLRNLSHLLSVSKVAPAALVNATRLYEAEGQLYPSLAVIYASALRRVIEVIVDRGLYKEYQRSEETTSFPCGRIAMGRTLQNTYARGNRRKVVVSYFRRSVNNPINQCLLYAVRRLSEYIDQISDELLRRNRRRARLDLNYAWNALQGVELDTMESFLDDGFVTGKLALPTLRSYYRPALDLALTIIGRQAVLVEQGGSHIELPSLVADMRVVFEAYVGQVLLNIGSERGWTEDVLDGNRLPPDGARGQIFQPGEVSVIASPDVVLRRRRAGRVSNPAIVEVKYKPASQAPDRDDLNQAITYGAAYRSPIVIVVQPRVRDSSRTSGAHLLGTVAEMRAYQYVIDLDGDMQLEEARLASELERLLANTS